MSKKFLMFDIDGTLVHAGGATTVALVSDFEPEEKLRAARPDHLLKSFKPLFNLWQLPSLPGPR